MFHNLDTLRRATVVVGYHVPSHPHPIWLGTGFLVNEGRQAITCAHVVTKPDGDSSPGDIIPLKGVVNGETAELCCWLFDFVHPNLHFVRMPVNDAFVLTSVRSAHPYFGEVPDVAALKLETGQFHSKFPGTPIPSLAVAERLPRQVGREIAIVGYPSTGILMSDKDGNMNCMQPLTQFVRLAGVLPHDKAGLPHLLAVDAVIARGSSGSPMYDMESGCVIGVVSHLLPFILDQEVEDKPDWSYGVPAGIGFGIPCEFFHWLSIKWPK